MQFLHEKRKAYFISVLVLWVVLWGLLLNGQTKVQEYQIGDIEKQYTVNRIDTIAGYKLNGDEIKVKDDIFYLEFFTKNMNIRALQVIFAEPYQYDASVKIYYSDIYGGFTELKTLEQNISKGDTSLVFNIPVENVQGIRVCIPNEFALKSIDVSQQVAKLVTMEKSHLKIVPFFVFDTFFSLAAVAFVFCRISKIMFEKKKLFLKLKTFGIHALIVMVTVVILGVIQYFVTAQFAVFNSGRLYINSYRLLFTVAFSFFGWKFWWLRDKWAKAPEKLFAVIAMSAGLVITVTMPMLSERSWDAAIHYQNTMSLANAFEDEYHYMDVGHLIISNNLNEVKEIEIKYNTEYLTSGVNSQNYTLGNGYSDLGHLPAAVGIFIAEGLHLSLIAQIWLGRFCVLLFYVTIMYVAIKRVKTGKMIMALIGLYPTCVMLSANYTYDPWLISFTMLGMSYLVNMVVTPEEELKVKDCALMLVAFVLGLGPKPVYFPLILLTLFVPRSKFKSSKNRRIYYGIIILCTLIVVAVMAAPMLMSGGGVSSYADNRGGSDIDPTAQLNFIFAYPLTYTKTLLKFLKYYWSFENTANYMTLLGYLGMARFHFIVLGLILLVVLTDCTGKEIYKCSIPYRLASVIMAFGTSCILATTFYLVYTGVGYDAIGGCQPRYLLPVLFPTAFALRNNRMDLKIKRKYYNAGVLTVAAFVVWYAVLQMIVRPYNIC